MMKYGIPKTDTPVEPWGAPEVEQIIRITYEKLHSFKGHTFNVEILNVPAFSNASK